MAFDVVTAKQGKPHVTADQQALMQAGMLGKGRYALDALNNLACTMTDSNTLTVDTGGLMVDGRWVVNEAQTSFAIANGSQAQFRKDLAVLEITVDPSTGVTSLEEKVLQGATAATAAAAADPTYEAGDLYTGLTAVVPIARITLNGLTPTCEALLPSVADLKTISEQTKKLGDSVSLIDGWYVYGINGVKVAIKALSVTVHIGWLYIDSIYGGDMESVKLPDGVFSAAPACSAAIAQASATCWIAPTTNSIPTKTETQRFRVLSSSKETISLRVMITAVGA